MYRLNNDNTQTLQLFTRYVCDSIFESGLIRYVYMYEENLAISL